jgi:type II secretory pathway component PulF
MNKFQRKLFQLTFSSEDRIDIYDNMRQYLLDGIGLEDTFDKMIQNYTRRGKSPNNPIAMILKECSDNLSKGFTLAESLREWIPEQELSVIESCDLAGRAHDGFYNAIRISEGADKIQKSIKNTVKISLYLVSLMLGVISMICILLVPILVQSVPLQQWTPPQLSIYYLYIFITDYSFIFLLIILIISYIVMKALPKWTGDLRYHFDKYPPFSIYKRLFGATFILNVDAMESSDISIEDALTKMSESSRSAWFSEKIDATLNAISSGDTNLGTALDSAGYEFPSEEAIIKMQSLFETSNKEGSLKRFGDKWLEKTIKSVESTGEKIKIACLIGTGVGLCAIVAIMFSLIQKVFHIG